MLLPLRELATAISNETDVYQQPPTPFRAKSGGLHIHRPGHPTDRCGEYNRGIAC